jgi:hypothetical protein
VIFPQKLPVTLFYSSPSAVDHTTLGTTRGDRLFLQGSKLGFPVGLATDRNTRPELIDDSDDEDSDNDNDNDNDNNGNSNNDNNDNDNDMFDVNQGAGVAENQSGDEVDMEID